MRDRCRERPLCPTSTVFRAFLVVSDSIAPVQPVRRGRCLDGTTHHPNEMRLPHCQAVTWSRSGIPSRLASIARRQHKRVRVQDGFRAYPAAGAALPRTPSPPPAFSAKRNSFLPWPGGPGLNQDRLPATYRSSVLKAVRWRARDSRADRDHWAALSVQLEGSQRLLAVVRSPVVQFLMRPAL